MQRWPNIRQTAIALLLAHLWMVGVASVLHTCAQSPAPRPGDERIARAQVAPVGVVADVDRDDTQSACPTCGYLQTGRHAVAVPRVQPPLPVTGLAVWHFEPSFTPLLAAAPLASRGPPAS